MMIPFEIDLVHKMIQRLIRASHLRRYTYLLACVVVYFVSSVHLYPQQVKINHGIKTATKGWWIPKRLERLFKSSHCFKCSLTSYSRSSDGEAPGLILVSLNEDSINSVTAIYGMYEGVECDVIRKCIAPDSSFALDLANCYFNLLKYKKNIMSAYGPGKKRAVQYVRVGRDSADFARYINSLVIAGLYSRRGGMEVYSFDVAGVMKAGYKEYTFTLLLSMTNCRRDIVQFNADPWSSGTSIYMIERSGKAVTLTPVAIQETESDVRVLPSARIVLRRTAN